MVRLKERLRHWTASGFLVSIPNGTIKSDRRTRQIDCRITFQFQMVRLKERNPKLLTCTQWFQFQMVRLKDIITIILPQRTKVSIPNGTIKRRDFQTPCSPPTLFQFQMVRLKVHRCRMNGMNACVSIPNGTIKSTLLVIPILFFSRFNSKWYD